MAASVFSNILQEIDIFCDHIDTKWLKSVISRNTS